MSESWTSHRARLAGATRHGNAELAAQARADLRFARLADHIRREVESWPPLTAEQLTKLGALLQPSTSDGAGDA